MLTTLSLRDRDLLNNYSHGNIPPMQSKQQFVLPALILGMLINFTGCSKSDSAAQNATPQLSPVASATRSPIPKQITPAELASLD